MNQYEDRLTHALRGAGIITSDDQVEALRDAVGDIVRDELASLGGHLLSTYGNGPDPATLTSAADPVKEAQDATLGTLGGYLLQEYGG